jgi:2-dehydro-3-deoxygluconokinase
MLLAGKILCFGELLLRLTAPGRELLLQNGRLDVHVAGAEANVAVGLARLRHRTAMASRVPAGALGDAAAGALRRYGVDTTGVTTGEGRMGLYFLSPGAGLRPSDILYDRGGSAFALAGPEDFDWDALLDGAALLHLSGITPALSTGCLGLTRELTARRPGRPLVSFDVNHRPGLWRDAGHGHGPEVLLELARGADIVFVGDDEARDAWSLDGPEAVRAALPEPEVLVIKQGATGATAFHGDHVTSVPALHVDVVAAVGAGDAFAAGFLSATLRERPVRERLRHGHLWAAAALTVPGDLATPPARDHADRLAALDDTAWGRLRLGPGWTQAEEGADEEVRTP